MANATLRCADERLNAITYEKFSSNLTLGLLGGIKWYLSRDSLEELFEQIEFVIDHKETKALTLISHTDCGLYQELGEDEHDRYVDDLCDAAKQIHERFPELVITAALYDVETKNLEKVALND